MPEDKNRRGVVSPPPTTSSLVTVKSGSSSARRYIIMPRYCEECGGRLVRVGYCFTCISCGWGGCA
ncbi:MAG: hypothetical protein KAR42_02625 [candidate division Zixibacteria bacterium]|nr:hypothetical protein [candidate division Zixibacteria bacterium]